MKTTPKSTKNKKATKPASSVVKPAPGCKGKAMGKEVPGTAPLKKKETREDCRQKTRVQALIAESKYVLSKLNEMRKIAESGKVAGLPELDRCIFMVAFASLQAYMAALTLKTNWENVRIQTASGVRLSGACTQKMVEFFLGAPGDKDSKKKSKKSR